MNTVSQFGGFVSWASVNANQKNAYFNRANPWSPNRARAQNSSVHTFWEPPIVTVIGLCVRFVTCAPLVVGDWGCVCARALFGVLVSLTVYQPLAVGKVLCVWLVAAVGGLAGGGQLVVYA